MRLAVVALLARGRRSRAAARAGAKTFPTRVQVTAKEFWFALSSRVGEAGRGGDRVRQLRPGRARHAVQRIGTTRVYSAPIVQPGDHYDLSVKLLPGRYLLWCSIANHKQLGMQATLIVRS